MKQGNANNTINKMAKLQWACRRGMLELDVLLGHFLKERYPGLSFEDKALFEKLLSCSDPQIFAWLMGQEVPAEKSLATITEDIRNHARSRI